MPEQAIDPPTREGEAAGTEAAEAPKASRSLWVNGDLNRLWLGHSLSMVGNIVVLLVLPLVAVSLLGATPSQLGLISAAQLAPILVIGPILGHLVDSMRRRPLLIFTSVGRCVVLAVLAILVASDSLQVWNLTLCALAMGTMGAMFDIAFWAYFPTVLSPEDFVPANARIQASVSVAQVGSSGLAGVLLRIATPAVAFLLNIGAFFAAAIAFATVRTPEPPLPGKKPGESFWRRFSFGFRIMFRERVLRVLLLEGIWFNFCEQAFMTVFLVFAVRSLGMTPDVIGLCISLGSVGAIAGSITAAGVGRLLRPATVLIAAMGLASAGPLLVPLATGDNWRSVALIVLSFCCYGFGLAVYNTHSISERQRRVESAGLGRASAAFRTLVFGALPLGAAAGGILAEALGNRTTLTVLGLLLVVAWVPFSLAIKRHMR